MNIVSIILIGAELFAKRKKRMDQFIVDETSVQKSSTMISQQQSSVVAQSSSTSVKQSSVRLIPSQGNL